MLTIKEWLLKNNPTFKIDWNILGWQNNPNFFGDQKEWNNVLLTKINEISAHIHMATLLGGADTIEVHPDNMHFIESFDYYNATTKTIGFRYSVIVDNLISKNTINVYLSEQAIRNFYKLNKKGLDIDFKNTYGVITLINGN